MGKTGRGKKQKGKPFEDGDLTRRAEDPKEIEVLATTAQKGSIAVAMVARNEEDSLPHALESIKNLADEIVVGIDPTTTDGTYAAASKWLKAWDPTGKRYKLIAGLNLEEVGFAETRNNVLKRVKSDWILILDCDETFPERGVVWMPGEDGRQVEKVFPSHEVMRSVLGSVGETCHMVTVTMAMLEDDGRLLSTFQGERIVRRGVRFRRPMHNHVALTAHIEGKPDQQGAQGPFELAIFHNRRHRTEAERQERSLQRVRMAEKFFLPDIEKNPDDSRSIFYLAGTYNDAGRHEEAAKYFQMYLDSKNTWPQERYQAAVFFVRATLNRQFEKVEDRKAAIEGAQRLAHSYITDNWERAELYHLLGDLAFEMRNYPRAAWWYEMATKRPAKLDPHFVEAATHSWLPRLQLARTHYAMGNIEKGEYWLREAQECGADERSLDMVHRTAMPYYPPIKKLAVFIDRGDEKFIKDMIERWGERYQVAVCKDLETVEQTMDWKPDAAWFEWAGPMLIEATKRPHQCRMITRVHGYEVHTPPIMEDGKSMIQCVNWSRVDNAIFVANYLREMAMEQVPNLKLHTSVHLVPGGINAADWTVAEGKDGTKLAMAGYINTKKNIPLALQILSEARKKRPELTLHIAGTRQDSREWQYIQQMIDELGLRQVVFFYPWQENLNGWFADKDYFLSVSREESMHYALAEGMAAGLRPIIHCWRSSRDFYPTDHIFRTVPEAVAMLMEKPTAEDRQRYRSWVAKYLSFEEQVRDIDLILKGPTVACPAPDTAPWRYEMQMAVALEAMGFAPALPSEADTLVVCGGAMGLLDEPSRNGQVRVLWNAENIAGKSKHARMRREQLKPLIGKSDFLVVSSPNMKEAAEKMGAENVSVVYQGGASPVWCKATEKEKSIDVMFYGTMNPRRKKVIRELNRRLKADGRAEVFEASSFDHATLADLIHRAKVVLNIHISDEPNLETRIGEVMAAGSYLLTETLPEGHPFVGDENELLGFAEWSDVDELMEKLVSALDNPKSREEDALTACSWIWMNMTVGHQVERLLENCGRRWPA